MQRLIARASAFVAGSAFLIVACNSAISRGPGIEALTRARHTPQCGAVRADLDQDGLDDGCELALAEEFAPVVLHSSAESVYPIDVDDFLRETSLEFEDDGCAGGRSDGPIVVAPSQKQLLGHSIVSSCGGAKVTSDGSRSARKRKTFFLTDVAESDRQGSTDTRRWKTYVHSYPNDLGGVTLQYWRAYPYNRAFADHGGDWEAVYVVLDSSRAVAKVGLLGHRSIDEALPTDLAWEGTHPRVFVDVGGHSSRRTGSGIASLTGGDVDPDDSTTFIRQESWDGGSVHWPDGALSPSGGLVPLGEKTHPKEPFLRYSGLWGSPGVFYVTSGYWGPAFNETGMRGDGFVQAWCDGMKGGKRGLDLRKECWPDATEP